MAKMPVNIISCPVLNVIISLSYLAHAPVIDISNSRYYKLYHNKKYSLGFSIMTFHYLLLPRILQCT